MKRLVLWTALALLVALPVPAHADKYIRAGVGGNGTSWSAACSGFSGSCAPSSFVRGETIWVASGSYGAVNFNTPTLSTTLVTVKKATVADHGNAGGWNDSFATGTAVFVGGMDVTTSNWLIDGQTGGGPGQWTTGFGFKIDVSSTGCNGLTVPWQLTNVTARHIEVQGHGPDGIGCQQDGLNIGSNPNGVATNPGSAHTFSYFYVHDMGRCPIFLRAHNTTFEYFYTGVFESTNSPGSGEHGEIVSAWIDFSQTLVQNPVFRWSLFTYAGAPDSTGGFLCNCNNMQVYGNVFAPVTLLNDWGNYGNGLVGIWSSDTQTNTKVYNNTFIGAYTHIFGDYNANDSIEVRNNLFFNSVVGNGPGGYQSAAAFTHTHNHYIQIGDGPISEATQSTGSTNPFASPGWQNLEFRLTANTTPGTTLASPYNTDMFGNPRTTWTRGAIEFAPGVPDTQPPSAPTNLQATSAGISQINLTWTAATDDVGVTAYRVERCQGSGCSNFAEISQPTTTSYNDTGLTASTLYRYRVRAQDAANNLGNYSSIAQATTDSIATPPTAPSNLRIAYAEVP